MYCGRDLGIYRKFSFIYNRTIDMNIYIPNPGSCDYKFTVNMFYWQLLGCAILWITTSIVYFMYCGITKVICGSNESYEWCVRHEVLSYVIIYCRYSDIRSQIAQWITHQRAAELVAYSWCVVLCLFTYTYNLISEFNGKGKYVKYISDCVMF